MENNMVLAMICIATIMGALLSCVVIAWYLDGEEVTATGNCESLGGPPRDSTYGP